MKKNTLVGWLNYLTDKISQNENKIEVVRIEPYFENNIDALLKKGIELSMQGQQLEAISCFNKAIEIDANCIAAWANKGVAEFKSGKYQDAINCYDKVLIKDQKDSLIWYNKGIALSCLRKYNDAILSYENALKYATPNDSLNTDMIKTMVKDMKSGNAIII